MKRFEYSDGEEIEYVDVGTGDVLVWIPGADGPKETFQYQLPRFAQSYRVICADMREAFSIGANFDRFVEDLEELLNDLEITARSIHWAKLRKCNRNPLRNALPRANAWPGTL